MIDLFYPARPPVRGARRIIRAEGKSPRAEYQAEYYRTHKDAIRDRHRAYYLANREKILKRVAKNDKARIEQRRANKRVTQRVK